MADRLFSLTLALAMAAAALAWIAWLVGRLRPAAGRDAWRRWQRRLAAAALGLVAASFAVHLPFGHRPGSPRALAPMAFFREHPAFPWVAVAGAAALAASRRRAGGR